MAPRAAMVDDARAPAAAVISAAVSTTHESRPGGASGRGGPASGASAPDRHTPAEHENPLGQVPSAPHWYRVPVKLLGSKLQAEKAQAAATSAAGRTRNVTTAS
jgi:hypothetical protein